MEKSLRLDEAQSLFQTNGTFIGTIRLIVGDIHLPIYFLLLQVWQILFGTSLFAIRSLSLIFLLASLPAIYLFAKEAYSKTIGYISVGLCAVSPFLNWFGAETRMYTLLFLITILNQFFFIRILHKKTEHSYTWLLYALTVFIGVYTHYFFIFVLFTQAVFYITNRELFTKGSFKRFLTTGTVATLMIVAWFVLRQQVGSTNSAPHLVPPTSIDVFNVFSNFIIGFQSDFINTTFLSLWPVMVLIVFTLLIKQHKTLPQTKYLLMSIFIPIALVFIVSSFIKPLFLSRYLIIVMPSLYILVIHYLSFYPKKVYISTIGFFFVLCSFSLYLQAFSKETPVHEDYREAVSYVESQIRYDDVFIVTAPFITYPIEYYYHGTARLITFPIWNRYEETKQIPEFTEDYLADTITNWSKNYSRFFVLMGYDQGYEEKTRLYLDKNFERIEVKNFSPGLNLYIYKIKYI